MGNVLYIDASNLNVLFEVDNKFCLGVNYSSNPERLALDIQALGSNYDVYISILPRFKDTGDVLIPGLNVGMAEFWALKAEIKAIFTAVSHFAGVNNIYLCNALSSFLGCARVDNFQTLMRYGSNYLLIDAHDRLPISARIFKTQREVYEELGEDFSCYGDLDLIDVDAIRAKYPELAKFRRAVLVPIAALIASKDTLCKLSMSDVNAQIARYVPEEEIIETVEEEPEEIVEEIESAEEIVEQKKPREKIDWVSFGLIAAVCLGVFITGYGVPFTKVDSIVESYAENLGSYQDEIAYQQSIETIYRESYGLSGEVADLLEYAKGSELEVTVSTVSGYNDRVALQFNCTSSDIKDQYVYFLERRYTVAGVNQYGTTNNTDGTITYEYGITLML